MHRESISVKNFIGLKPRMFSPVNLSMFTVCPVLWVNGHWIHLTISCWLHFLTWMIKYRYLYTKSYKADNTYHQVFCYPESVNTKWENPMVYSTNFMQCVCTAYCESWIVSLSPFIMNSCYQLLSHMPTTNQINR